MTPDTIHDWATDPPPRDVDVLARWHDDEEFRPVHTCRHGCCVSDEFASLILPTQRKEAS